MYLKGDLVEWTPTFTIRGVPTEVPMFAIFLEWQEREDPFDELTALVYVPGLQRKRYVPRKTIALKQCRNKISRDEQIQDNEN